MSECLDVLDVFLSCVTHGRQGGQTTGRNVQGKGTRQTKCAKAGIVE